MKGIELKGKKMNEPILKVNNAHNAMLRETPYTLSCSLDSVGMYFPPLLLHIAVS